MSDTQSEPAPARDSFGISDILAEREGQQPPDMLPNNERVVEEETKPSPQSDAESVADQLRRDAAEQRARAIAAEQRAAEGERREQQATAEVHRTRQQSIETEYNSVSAALTDREAEADRLKSEMRSAAEAGDVGRQAEISLRLGEVGAELVTLRQGKQAFESDRAQRLRQPEPAPQQQQRPADWSPTLNASKEQFLGTRTPPTAEWLRKNDKFFTDRSFFNIITGADAIAQGKGIAPDSPEYFRFIEEQAGMTQAPTRQQQRGSTAPPSAPPSRDAPGPTGRDNRQGDIHISAEDRRIAGWMKIPAEDYAREKAKLYASGELPHRRR